MNRPKQLSSQNKIKIADAKQFFHLSQPYEAYGQTKKFRNKQSQNLKPNPNQSQQKQDRTMFFQFRKPKSGYYTLKGCKLQKLLKNERHNKENRTQAKVKHQFLNYFVKKYVQRNQYVQNEQHIKCDLPQIKQSQPYLYPSAQYIHSKSTVLEQLPLNQTNTKINCITKHSLKYFCRLKTEPVEKNKKMNYPILQKNENNIL